MGPAGFILHVCGAAALVYCLVQYFFAIPEFEDSQALRRTLYASSPNLAPSVNVDTSLCSSPALWGRAHAGGWEVCLQAIDSAEPCLVYSFGLGADWSFDNHAESKSCEVHGFDPTGQLWRDGMHGADYQGIDYMKQYPSKSKFFHNYGLGAASRATYPAASVPQEWPGLGDPQLSKSNTEPWEMRSFAQIFVDLGHLEAIPSDKSVSVIIKPHIRKNSAGRSGDQFQIYQDAAYALRFVVNKRITVLKVDVEGAEWDAFAAMLSSPAMVEVLRSGFIRQLLVEWHWDPDSRARNARHSATMNKLQEIGFKPWRINRHEGSDCCLDMSYVWVANH